MKERSVKDIQLKKGMSCDKLVKELYEDNPKAFWNLVLSTYRCVR